MFSLGRKSSNQMIMSEIRTFYPICPITSWDFRHSKSPKSEQNSSDFGHCLNTQPSGTGPKVDHPKSELVRISDIQCMNIKKKVVYGTIGNVRIIGWHCF